jgi:anaphase-promoting complex subunit 3
MMILDLKPFQVTGRLFNQSSESIPRRSARLSRDTPINSNSNISQFGGNGTDHSSGKLRVNSSTSSKLCSTERSVQVRKGKPRATENFDEGDYRFNANDPSNCINVSRCG